MQQDGPLVSILTPSLDHARWLEENLRSVAEQTYPAIEHIVMDGGSSDGTIALLEGCGPKVRWRSEPDRGQSHALNKAFNESRGDIIGWINSDDAYFLRDAVESAVEVFERDPDVDVVYGHSVMVDEAGAVIHIQWTPRFGHRLLSLGQYIVQPTVFFRRRVLSDPMVAEDHHFAMDRELLLRLSMSSKFARVNEILAIDRRVEQRKSADVTSMLEGHARVDRAYGIPGGLYRRVLRRLLWGFFVLRGTSLAKRVGDGDLTTRSPGTGRLIASQLKRGLLILSPVPWRWASPS